MSPTSGAVLPLEDEIHDLIDQGKTGQIAVLGDPGMGKTTCIRHLKSVFIDCPQLILLDHPSTYDVVMVNDQHLTVYATSPTSVHHARMRYRLAPWGNDEFIEYLLSAHREQCASVMARVKNSETSFLRGIPQLWRIALDGLAANPGINNSVAALRAFVESRLPDTDSLQRSRKVCLDFVSSDAPHRGELTAFLAGHALPTDVVAVLRHEPMAMIFAADQMADDLRSQSLCEFLGRQMPRELVQLVAQRVSGDAEALASLHAHVRGLQTNHAMAASVLHAANVGWVPDSDHVPLLNGGYFPHAVWPQVRLVRANLSKADLSSSDLRNIVLNQAWIMESNLRGANLSKATCISMDARHCDLSDANLSSVCAERARFDHATLSSANLDGANLGNASFFDCDLSGAVCRRADFTQSRWGSTKIDGADFTGAIFDHAHLGGHRLNTACFTGARFRGALLALANLEDMALSDADFSGADLSKALLTGSQIPRGNFLNADLRGAGLADIDWEGACLRHSDLRDVSFHMGSTRSGLLFTPIASEGTRTGFYTDDFDEQTFKAPEEIRKANLRGADLRGANVEGTDFYLVDLRDALYDPAQEEHFRRCKAILKTPIES